MSPIAARIGPFCADSTPPPSARMASLPTTSEARRPGEGQVETPGRFLHRLAAAPAPRGAATTSQGSLRHQFTRALERGDVTAAIAAAKQMGGLSLGDALALCVV